MENNSAFIIVSYCAFFVCEADLETLKLYVSQLVHKC